MSELLWKNSFLFCLSAEKLQIQLCKQLNRYHQAHNGFHTVCQKCVCELNVQLCFFPGKEKKHRDGERCKISFKGDDSSP